MFDTIIYAFDLFGTAVFAVTGAIKGVRNRLDFLGVIFFAITVGCGGGILRDVLLDVPVVFFQNYAYVLVSIIAAVAVFLLSPKIVKQWGIIQYCDAFGLGVFTAIGCTKAIEVGFGWVAIISSGVFSAVGGGILRDVFSKEIPLVFTSDFYATASIAGAILFILLLQLGVQEDIILFATAITVTTLRLLGHHYRWRLPVARMVGEAKWE